MQPHAKHLDVFVRTAVWFVQIANNFGQNHEYSDEHKAQFKKDPRELVVHAKDIEDQVNGLWGVFYQGTEAQKMGREMFKKRMAEFIKDERLLKGFTPEFGVGCRRITPGDPYMLAIQEENVDVHFTAVERATETGVVGEDGVEREVDTIVCATGESCYALNAFRRAPKHSLANGIQASTSPTAPASPSSAKAG